MGGSGSGLGRKESTRQFVQIPCKNIRYLKGTVRRKQQGLNLYQTIDIRLLFTADTFFLFKGTDSFKFNTTLFQSLTT